MSWFKSVISKTVWTPMVTTVRTRYFDTKKSYIRRYNYKDPVELHGLKPRNIKYKTVPDYRPVPSWNVKHALFGQNDYIDILGDRKLHPVQVSYNVPSWIRGFKGNEYQTLLRRRKLWAKTAHPHKYPTKWYNLQKRIRFLYKWLNCKTKTGMPPI